MLRGRGCRIQHCYGCNHVQGSVRYRPYPSPASQESSGDGGGWPCAVSLLLSRESHRLRTNRAAGRAKSTGHGERHSPHVPFPVTMPQDRAVLTPVWASLARLVNADVALVADRGGCPCPPHLCPHGKMCSRTACTWPHFILARYSSHLFPPLLKDLHSWQRPPNS